MIAGIVSSQPLLPAGAVTGWAAVGNTATVTGIADLVGLTSTRIAAVGKGGSTDELRTYDYDGTDWSQTGNSLATGLDTNGLGGITKLGSNTVVVNGYFSGSSGYRVYSFDGTDWAQDDSDLNWFLGDISAISSTNIVQVDRESGEIFEEYTFLNPSWDFVTDSADGIIALSSATAAAMSSTLVAVLDEATQGANNFHIRAYEKSGGSWSNTGTDLSIGTLTATDRNPIVALSATRVIILNSATGEIQSYDWSGSAWSAVGGDLDVSFSSGAVAFLSSTTIAGLVSSSLTKYEFTP